MKQERERIPKRDAQRLDHVAAAVRRRCRGNARDLALVSVDGIDFEQGIGAIQHL
jgi:hypothetical protein